MERDYKRYIETKDYLTPSLELDKLVNGYQKGDCCISPRNEEMVKFIYGSPNDLPIDNLSPLPPTPNSSIKKVAQRVKKEHFNSVLATRNDVTTAEDFFANIVDHMREENNEKAFNSNNAKKSAAPTSIEPSQNFWFSSETVQNVRLEIRAIKIKDKAPLLLMEEKFNDSTSNVLRTMKHLKMFDCKKTKKNLNDRMNYFVREIARVRKTVFESALKERIIKYENLNSEQKIEFSQYKPAKKIKYIPEVIVTSKNDIPKNDEIEKKVEDIIAENVEKLPPEYRIRSQSVMNQTAKEIIDYIPKCIEEKLSKSLAREEKKRPMTQEAPLKSAGQIVGGLREKPRRKARIVQSQLSKRVPLPKQISSTVVEEPKVMERSDVYKEYWSISDPLVSKRNGKYFDPAVNFKKLISDINVEICNFDEQELSIPNKLNIKETPIVAKKENILSRNVDHNDDFITKGKEEKIPERPIDPALSAALAGVRNGKKSPISVNIDDREYLLNETLKLIKNKDETGTEVFQRLENVWDRMGFSTIQKLEMAAKYSRNVEESSRLAESLDVWESTESIVKRYNNAYNNLKDYLEFEVIPPIRTDNIVFCNLMQELSNATEFLLQMYDQMKGTVGDELVIDRMRVKDVIPYRKKKIDSLIAELSKIPVMD